MVYINVILIDMAIFCFGSYCVNKQKNLYILNTVFTFFKSGVSSAIAQFSNCLLNTKPGPQDTVR